MKKPGLKENRRHRRVSLKCRVEINHPLLGKHVVEMKDFSDSGIFLYMEADKFPPLGTIVKGQVLGMQGDEAPVVDMEVVRIEKSGIGLRFVDENIALH